MDKPLETLRKIDRAPHGSLIEAAKLGDREAVAFLRTFTPFAFTAINTRER